MNEIVYREESYRIMGACFEVYKEKGCGFLEAVFQECLEIEFTDQTIPFVSHQNLALDYKGRPLKQVYTPDFVCFEKIIVEIKAVTALWMNTGRRFTTTCEQRGIVSAFW